MSFGLSEQQKIYQAEFFEFAGRHIAPFAGIADEEERFPDEAIRKIAEKGWLGIPVHKKYGGMGLDSLTYALCIEALSASCASTGVIVSSHTSLCSETIGKYGSKEQKNSSLRSLASGKSIGAFALTERGAGSDLSGIETRAEQIGNEYVLTGKKVFITNAGKADIYIVFALTDPEKGAKGLSAFIVGKDSPGFSVDRIIPKMGIRASVTGELSFNKCRIPLQNRLGDLNEGFSIAMSALDSGRIGIGAQALGIAHGAYVQTESYLKKREQFSRSLSSFQHIKFEMADMNTRIEAARLLVYRAAQLKDSGSPYRKEAAMAKLFSSQTAMDVTTRCLQLHGGYGYTRELPLERMMRDAKITEIYEGTNEVMRMIISSEKK